MNRTRWTATATEDLLLKVRTEAVRDELLLVASTALDDPPGAFGESLANGLHWRRGVTAESRRALEAAEREGRDLDGDKERPWQFALVYKRKWRIGLVPIWVVLGVVTEAELFAGHL